jgi:ubiquinone/menaquinone biosynthesis C-methylase UbiE
MLAKIKKALLFEKHTCPWWLAYTWDNRIRTLFHNTDVILKPYLNPGMTALDVGCGMGYFSIRMARYIAPDGKVISVDIQKEMLTILKARADKHAVGQFIQPVLSHGDLRGILDRIDFALNFWMLHEVDSQEKLIRQIHDRLNPGGTYLIVEPKIHTSFKYFESVVERCKKLGFNIEDYPHIGFSRSVLLSKS